jgi:hypothetical protein
MHFTALRRDLATNVFRLRGVDAWGRAVLSRPVKRSQLLDTMASLPPCVIGMEARRECASLGQGVWTARAYLQADEPPVRHALGQDQQA